MVLFQKFLPENWLGTAVLTVLFLMLFLLLFFWLVPRAKLITFARVTSPIIKLALVLNYFTVLLVMQIVISIFPEKAWIVIMLCIISWCAFHGFLWLASNVWTAMGRYFEESANQFDPTAFQGRRARTDRGGRRQG